MLQKGVICAVDKPLKWTSFDVVNKLKATIRHHYQLKKIKIGHAGTLDPLATGVVVVCIGLATKQISALQSFTKTYIASIFLGATTPSYDLETPITHHTDVKEIDSDKLNTVLKESFTGLITQVPPIYSALKVDGKRLYKLARKGVECDIPSREVCIHQIEALDIIPPIVRLRVECSKGTYIRSLAHDLGQAMGTGGYLHSLVRTSVGKYQLDEAYSIEELVDTLKNGTLPPPPSLLL